jgi:hypothetical protein
MFYGFGVDELNGATRSKAVTHGEPETAPGGGQIVSFSIDRANSFDSLQQALGVSIGGSGSYGAFGGSTKYEFSKRTSFTSFTQFLFVHVKVLNAYAQLVDEELSDEARSILVSGKAERFRERYGDFYVKGIQTGGEYFAWISISTKSREDYQSVSSEIEGGGFLGAGSFDACAQFSQTILRLSTSHRISMAAYQSGGSDMSQPTTIEEITKKASNFPQEVLKQSVAFLAYLQDYRTLDLPDCNLIDVRNRLEVLGNLSRTRAELIQRYNEIEYVQMFPNQFKPITDDLQKLKHKTAKLIDQVTKAASDCFESSSKCEFPGNLRIPDYREFLERRPLSIMPNIHGLQLTTAARIIRLGGLKIAGVYDSNQFDLFGRIVQVPEDVWGGYVVNCLSHLFSTPLPGEERPVGFPLMIMAEKSRDNHLHDANDFSSCDFPNESFRTHQEELVESPLVHKAREICDETELIVLPELNTVEEFTLNTPVQNECFIEWSCIGCRIAGEAVKISINGKFVGSIVYSNESGIKRLDVPRSFLSSDWNTIRIDCLTFGSNAHCLSGQFVWDFGGGCVGKQVLLPRFTGPCRGKDTFYFTIRVPNTTDANLAKSR